MVLPSYLRVNLTDALQHTQSTGQGGPLAASLVTATTAWAHTQPAACPQHVLLSNHYQHLRQLAHPTALQGATSTVASHDGRGMVVLHSSTSTPHRYITIKQGSLQAIETAVDDVRKTLVASKLAMAKRLLQWCSEEQKRAASIVLQQLQQQPLPTVGHGTSLAPAATNVAASVDGAGRKAGKRKQFLADASVSDSYEAQPKPMPDVTPSRSGGGGDGVPTHKASAKRQAATSRPIPVNATTAEIEDDEGVMVMVNEAMRATSLDSPRPRPQPMSEEAFEYGDNDDGDDDDGAAAYEDDYENEHDETSEVDTTR